MDTRTDTPQGRDTPTVAVPPAAAPPAPLPIVPAGGTPYELLGEIGRGGMSVVYLARDLRLGRCVALKRLMPSGRANPELETRFLREARVIASLNHIHIVRLFDAGDDAEGPFLVMEYIAGPGKSALPDRPAPPLSLEQKVEQNRGPLWPREAVSLLRKLCSAIDYAHRSGIIHRDLKPSNVLLDEFGEPRVADFGIARQLPAADVGLTLTGTRLFSLGYGAPEQETDAGLADARSDVYSLGGILYFCLTGENPRFFRDGRVVEYLRPALLKALARDPAQRWATPADFAAALTECVADYQSPISDVGMWRCKWCNALNPLSARYCHQCRWDGMEQCPECAGETRVGVRFCGACGTDIKTFESLRALGGRLRDYRRGRDFSRLVEAADAAPGFEPRGPLGQELLGNVTELADTAVWAQRRKEEIGNAITAALAQQQYEVVRERVLEYELLADDGVYDELRRELPWRMAERDLLAVCRAAADARDALARRQLAAARTRIEDARRGHLHLARIAAQFPALQPLFAGATDREGAPAFARELARVTAEIETLAAALGDADASVARLIAEARKALREQDYARALRCCRTVAETSADTTAAEAIAAESRDTDAHIGRRLGEARAALAQGKCRDARRLCQLVLDQYQANSAEATALLGVINRTASRRVAIATLLAAGVAALLYVLSIAPAQRALEAGWGGPAEAGVARFNACYQPVRWLHAHTLLRRPLDAYLRWWNLPPLR